VVSDVLATPGAPLPPPVREYMEPRLGHDFSTVRVHQGAAAAESATALGAEAYTVGPSIVLGAAFDGFSESGKRELLAHELAHVVHQRRGDDGTAPDGSLVEPAETERGPLEQEAERTAGLVGAGMNAVVEGVVNTLATVVQRVTLGTRFSHPTGARSTFRVLAGSFDGLEFVLRGDGTELMRVAAQSGRPITVAPADVTACGGAPDDSYLNNSRYVGIHDKGPIPEGEYQFRATQLATFTGAEQAQMIGGGHFTDPFGVALHGGDWGAGRVGLTPMRILAGRRGCGNTRTRSGFFLHGGILTGSSGCIDIGDAGIATLVSLLAGFRDRIVVTVRYTHAAPSVGAATRAMGRFTYPGQEDPTIGDRLKALFDF
jgi:hypothetical protein